MPTSWFSTTFSPDRPAKRPVGAVALPPGKGAVASSRRLRALPRKTQPSSAERHRASRAGRLRPERPYGSQLFSLPPTYKPPTEKVRPCAHPPRRSAPGRIGRRCGASQRAQKKSPPQARPGSPYDGRHHPTNRTAARKPRSQIARPSAAPRGGRNFVAAPPATGPSPKKNLAPRSLAARWVYFGRPRGFQSILLTQNA